MGEVFYLHQSAMSMAEAEMNSKSSSADQEHYIPFREAMLRAGQDLTYRVEVLEEILTGKFASDRTAMICIRDMARIAVYLKSCGSEE